MRQLLKFARTSLVMFRLYLLVAAISAVLYFSFADVPAWTLYSTLLMYFVYGCLGVVVTFHRGLTHRSYKTHPLIENVFTFFGVLAGTGSSIAWVNMHVLHHKYSDAPRDPHSPSNGVFKMFALSYNVPDELTKPAKALMRSRYHLFLHKYYNLIHIGTAAVLFTLFGVHILFGFYVLPMIVTALMSNMVNYLGHKHGYTTYNTKDNSTNSFIAAALSFGEGWHNNHHKFPSAANFGGHKWWEFDFSYQVIKLIQKKS